MAPEQISPRSEQVAHRMCRRWCKERCLPRGRRRAERRAETAEIGPRSEELDDRQRVPQHVSSTPCIRHLVHSPCRARARTLRRFSGRCPRMRSGRRRRERAGRDRCAWTRCSRGSAARPRSIDRNRSTTQRIASTAALARARRRRRSRVVGSRGALIATRCCAVTEARSGTEGPMQVSKLAYVKANGRGSPGSVRARDRNRQQPAIPVDMRTVSDVTN